jgi:hypothetical protein
VTRNRYNQEEGFVVRKLRQDGLFKKNLQLVRTPAVICTVLAWLISDYRYISLVAAMCMVLYGYDASVFNSLQGSNNWLAYFDLDPVSSRMT